jgi:hypothetical protein
MKNLKSLSNEVLLQNTQALVAEERKLTTQVLWHLNEIQRRRLYAEHGYGSLFEYTVQCLGYSEAAAGRRIAAMRLLVEVPEISPTQTEIKFVADDKLMEKLRAIREIDAHVLNNPSYLELFHRIADLALRELDPSASKKPVQKKTVTTPPEELTQAQPKSRYIPASLKREVWKRDQGKCTYKSPDGKRCESRFALEIDHKTPWSLGGRTELGNLRLLCRAHNRQQAFAKLGAQVMGAYLSR